MINLILYCIDKNYSIDIELLGLTQRNSEQRKYWHIGQLVQR